MRMTRRRLLPFALAGALAAAACSGGGGGSPAPSGSAEACATSPAPDADATEAWSPTSQDPSIYPQIINPAGTIACGATRLMFSFLDDANTPVAAPDRTVELALYDLGTDPEAPVQTIDATFVWAIEDAVGVYIANADFSTAGIWGAEFRTATPDTPLETIRVQFDVQPEGLGIGVGDAAPASDTPTLADVGGDVSQISTDDEPVEAFYETSVADALAAKEPFVLAFATPKFCVSAQCGPTLDRLKPIAAAHPDLTVINVEPYQLEYVDGGLQAVLTGDPPNLTLAESAAEWGLAAEPWIFVVDGNGIVTASLMLIFADEELETAIAAVE
jgi:hypothetical protein